MGKHEPGSKRSFYFSLATATLRAGLVIAAVILGVFVLTRAFPTDSEAPVSEPAPTETEPTEPQPTEEPEEPAVEEPQPSPPVEGVTVQVRNGTNETGLAAQVTEQLDALGYRLRDPSNAARNYDQTTLFFSQGARLAARHLRDTQFPGALLERKPEGQDPGIRIIVVIGIDFLEAQ